jgi:HSP20 family protein
MALIRWEPAREINSLQSEMNRLFNTFFDTPAGTGNGAALRRWIPPMDLVETEDHFVLRADLPGLAEEDVSIELEDTVLTISGERKAEHEERQEGYYGSRTPRSRCPRSRLRP